MNLQSTIILAALYCLYGSTWAADNPVNGKGTSNYPDGSSYTGEFKNGKFNGQGVLKLPKGSVLTGEFKDGLLNGQGTRKYNDGAVLTGEFKNGKLNGQGVLTYGNGDVYTGEFKDDLANGQGTLKFSKGDVYTGQFKDDYFYGQGTLRAPNGDVYTGQFKDGKRSGSGTLTSKNGTMVSCVDGVCGGKLILVSPQKPDELKTSGDALKQLGQEKLISPQSTTNTSDKKLSGKIQVKLDSYKYFPPHSVKMGEGFMGRSGWLEEDLCLLRFIVTNETKSTLNIARLVISINNGTLYTLKCPNFNCNGDVINLHRFSVNNLRSGETQEIIGDGSERDGKKCQGKYSVEIDSLTELRFQNGVQYEGGNYDTSLPLLEQYFDVESKVPNISLSLSAEIAKRKASRVSTNQRVPILKEKFNLIGWRIPIKFSCTSIRHFPNGGVADAGDEGGIDAAKSEFMSRSLGAIGVNHGWNQPPYSFRSCENAKGVAKVTRFWYEDKLEIVLLKLEQPTSYSAIDFKDLNYLDSHK